MDIFSLGMFIFELLTCRMPFAEMNNPSSLVCQGGRPSLTTQVFPKLCSFSEYSLSVCNICLQMKNVITGSVM